MDQRIEHLTFGVEFEHKLPAGRRSYDLADAISAAIGAPCVVVPYNQAHQTITTWKVVQDGTCGWEVVSPVLQGEAGLAQMRKVQETMVAFGCELDSNCSTHVHIGVGRNPDVNFLKRLVKTYSIFEGAIDTVIQPSRRANVNQWCRTLTTIPMSRIDGCQTWRDFASYSVLPHDRYYKVNVLSLIRRPTVEFRHHGATLEFEKIANWIFFCMRLVLASQNATIAVPSTGSGTTQQVNRARYGSKSWQIGQLLLRPEGVTAPEAMAAVGWPSVSMVQQARICGLTLVKERMGRSIRFFARAFSATASTQIASGPATLERLLEAIGATFEERAFFTARAAHFAARHHARTDTAHVAAPMA